MKPFRLWLTLLFCVTLLSTPGLLLTAQASLIDSITRDFTPLDGYVIMPINDEYLIDIDSSQGAKIGDLFSIYLPGEKIIHPITGKTIGTLNETLAVLSITRIKSGYSYAKVIAGETKLSKGTPIKRFAEMTARLSSQSASAAKLYPQLTNALPSLDWQGLSIPGRNETKPPADLLFTLTDTRLEVRNSLGQMFRSYPTDKLTGSYVPPKTAPRVAIVTPPAKSTDVKWQKPATVKGLVNYENSGARENLLGTINARTLMADFVTTPEGLLLAATDGSTIRIFRVTDRLQPVAEYNYATRSIHAVSWWQPTSGSTYLTVSGSAEGAPTASTSTETTPLSSILKFSAHQLTPVIDNLDYFLGTFDRDSDGARETLLGQSLDLDIFYGRIVQLHLQGRKLRTSKLDFKLPQPFPVQSSLFADLTADGKQETATLTSGLLTIYQGKQIIYQSEKEMGGSISQLTYDTNPGQIDALFTSVPFEVAPVSGDIDNDGQLELIAISSDRPTIITPGRPDISEIWLSVFKYRNGRIIKGQLGSRFNQPLQGIHVQQDRILLVTTDPYRNDSTGEQTSVVSVSLRKK